MLDKAPNGKVSDLLGALDKALSAGEIEHAVDLFQADCYWRDLVTFTWNIKTMEGKDQVRDMLKARLADTKPSNWNCPFTAETVCLPSFCSTSGDSSTSPSDRIDSMPAVICGTISRNPCTEFITMLKNAWYITTSPT